MEHNGCNIRHPDPNLADIHITSTSGSTPSRDRTQVLPPGLYLYSFQQVRCYTAEVLTVFMSTCIVAIVLAALEPAVASSSATKKTPATRTLQASSAQAPTYHF